MIVGGQRTRHDDAAGTGADREIAPAGGTEIDAVEFLVGAVDLTVALGGRKAVDRDRAGAGGVLRDVERGDAGNTRGEHATRRELRTLDGDVAGLRAVADVQRACGNGLQAGVRKHEAAAAGLADKHRAAAVESTDADRPTTCVDAAAGDDEAIRLQADRRIGDAGPHRRGDIEAAIDVEVDAAAAGNNARHGVDRGDRYVVIAEVERARAAGAAGNMADGVVAGEVDAGVAGHREKGRVDRAGARHAAQRGAECQRLYARRGNVAEDIDVAPGRQRDAQLVGGDVGDLGTGKLDGVRGRVTADAQACVDRMRGAD